MEKAVTFLREANIPISGTWVDCGCGYGYYSQALYKLGARPVLALDYRLHMTRTTPQILVIRGNCSQIPVKTRSASGFLYVNVLHYYKNPSPLVEEAARVLKPTGYIVVIEYDQSTSTPWDPYPLSPAVIEALFKAANLEPIKTLTVDRKYRPKHLVVGTKILF